MMSEQPSHHQQLAGSKRRRPEILVDSRSKGSTMSFRSSHVAVIRGGRSQTPYSERSGIRSPQHCLISDDATAPPHTEPPISIKNIALLANHEFEDFLHVKRAVFRRLAASLICEPAIATSGLPVHTQLCVWLLTYIHGMSLSECSKLFTLSVPEIEGVMQAVTSAILTTCGKHLRWYNDQAKQKTATISFEELCGLPGIVAAIGSTSFTDRKHDFPAVFFQVIRNCSNVCMHVY
jgi:hypothetical protein